ILMNGNLNWCPARDAKPPDGLIDKVRAAKGSRAIQAKYPGGWEANSFIADPRFIAFDLAVSAKNDYRLAKDSPAVEKGVVLSKELTDPQRPAAGAKPDIGAIPLGAAVHGFGRHARAQAPTSGADASPSGES